MAISASVDSDICRLAATAANRRFSCSVGRAVIDRAVAFGRRRSLRANLCCCKTRTLRYPAITPIPTRQHPSFQSHLLYPIRDYGPKTLHELLRVWGLSFAVFSAELAPSPRDFVFRTAVYQATTGQPAFGQPQMPALKRPFIACVRLSVVENKIDFTKHAESELVDMFSRLDPRFAPAECERLAKYLADRGYIVTEGSTGRAPQCPHQEVESLTGAASPIKCAVNFGQSTGPFRRFEPAHNDFNFVGAGTLEANGVEVQLSGRLAGALPGILGSFSRRTSRLLWQNIVNVECAESVVYFDYHSAGTSNRGITLWLADSATAEQIVAILPKERTADFRPQLKVHADFERNLIAQSPKTPVTLAFITLNALVFLAMGIGGAGWLIPNRLRMSRGGPISGPSTDGECWVATAYIDVYSFWRAPSAVQHLGPRNIRPIG